MDLPATHMDPQARKFTEKDVDVLFQLMALAEKRKWKEITKEINRLGLRNRGEPIYSSLPLKTSSAPCSKNVSPTYVIKQYQNSLGLPKNTLCFGVLGSSLPYIVSPTGWDCIEQSSLQDKCPPQNSSLHLLLPA